MLTVIASEGYKDFVADLQKVSKEALHDRPQGTIEYFTGKTIMAGEQAVVIDVTQARLLPVSGENDYIDDNDNVTELYRTDLENNRLVVLPETLASLGQGVHTLVQVFSMRGSRCHDSKWPDQMKRMPK